MDAAMARFGGGMEDWIDLSTGINPRAYPMPEIQAIDWQALPTSTSMAGLCEIAAKSFGTSASVLPVAGAQAGIQMIPRILPVGRARILEPTYNEHAASLRSAGWAVEPAATLTDLEGADLAVVVNPNNPDGQSFGPSDLLRLSRSVGHLIVDESFADPLPALSLASRLDDETTNILILRSFGKFFGLAGLRLGFVLGPSQVIAPLREMSGPWPISGPAIRVARQALADWDWQTETTARLISDAARLDVWAETQSWTLVGGTPLFRLYDTKSSISEQTRLAQSHIWTRAFPYSDRWLRLGLPDGDAQWDRLQSLRP